MKAMFIYNPSSGKADAEQFKETTINVLEGLGYKVIIKETEKQNDATVFAKEACAEKIDFLLAMGGDGTINEVVNGLAEQLHRPLFSFIPLGTVNDFARALGIPLDPHLAIEAVKMSHTQMVDIGQIGDKYFMNIVAIGEIASRVAEATVEQKTKMGSLAYLLEGMKAIISDNEVEMTITHDSGIWKGTPLLLLVALTNSVGGFEKMINSAEVNDGKLHIYIIKQAGLTSIARMGAKILLGNLEKDNGVEMIETSSVLIESKKPLYCNVDGDEGDCTPLEIKVLPKHIKMLIPLKD
ncbi:diacylglycerol/lipid kinase family protein [Psychrobacillus psychrodurans]|uniref:Diacylglycerol kinase family lipid kinase n=1 Tax=Psychrobacillus psychrodurans TaxID=126157 RepID=A0A9X3LAV2_9BACI|nr:diacylglycerol kinase family protein [Psychrobacillus psychrodurans]MCZ8534372.1 diacylglycerol kinase family lipid kinase [Psychrobacillus psychrodurans]